MYSAPSEDGAGTTGLTGNPVLATITVSSDQSLVDAANALDLPNDGTANVNAPEKLCRTSKSEDA
jgi:hypothetical protein